MGGGRTVRPVLGPGAFLRLILPMLLLAGRQPPADRSPVEILSPIAPRGAALAVVVAIRPQDCVTCSLFNGFSAMRRAQQGMDARAPEVVVVVITRNAGDTSAVRHSLRSERLTPRMQLLSPPRANRILGRPLPAIYVLRGRQVLRQWHAPVAGGTIAIARDAIVDAFGDTVPTSAER